MVVFILSAFLFVRPPSPLVWFCSGLFLLLECMGASVPSTQLAFERCCLFLLFIFCRNDAQQQEETCSIFAAQLAPRLPPLTSQDLSA